MLMTEIELIILFYFGAVVPCSTIYDTFCMRAPVIARLALFCFDNFLSLPLHSSTPWRVFSLVPDLLSVRK